MSTAATTLNYGTGTIPFDWFWRRTTNIFEYWTLRHNHEYLHI